MEPAQRATRPRVATALFLTFSLLTAALAQREHSVASGETLYSLAERYGTTVARLREENALVGDLLRVGQKLRLPQTQGGGFRSYAATPGESLASVARLHGLTVETLLMANPEHRPDALTPGAVLRIPPVDGATVRLSGDETLLELALRYGVSPAELLHVNALEGLLDGAPGDWLLIPGAEPFADSPVQALSSTDASSLPVGPAASASATATSEPRLAPQPQPNGDPMHASSSPVPTDGVGGADWHDARQRELLGMAPELLAHFRPASEEFVKPLDGTLSSLFGWRNISVGGNRFHGGIDLAVDVGTPVVASRDGIVVRTGWIGAYGYAVYISHGDGVETRYAHLSELLVGEGEAVRQGDVIGLAGSTGASTGPHLHFEIRVDGYAVDPLTFFRP